METAFSVFLTNLSAYNDGVLLGEWVALPINKKELETIYKKLRYEMDDEEFFITDYEPGIVSVNFGEFPNMRELNYLAFLISQSEKEYGDTVKYVFKSEEPSSAKEAINTVLNLDSFVILGGIEDYSDLGGYFIDELYTEKELGPLSRYIDYERYGRDIHLDFCGHFIRIENDGKLKSAYAYNDDSSRNTYTGLKDIPEDYDEV